MKKIDKCISLICLVFLDVICLFGCIKIVFFNKSLYIDFYNKNNLVEDTRLSKLEYNNAINSLISYIQDDMSYEELHMYSYHGEEMYTDRELLHMKDVKKLYQSINYFCGLLLIDSIAVLLLLFITYGRIFAEELVSLAKGNLAIIFTSMIFLLIFIWVDFDDFWLKIHYLLFDNTLFFLDPDNSILINMVPEDFFFTMVRYTVYIYILLLLMIYYSLKRILIHIKKGEKHEIKYSFI